MRSPRLIPIVPLAALLSGCAIHDSDIARNAQKRLIGIGEADLETCLGAPDQHSSFGTADIITYEFNSTASTSWSLPIVQGPSFSNGGNCRMTIRFDNQVSDRILYSGEKNGTAAPSSYCAPIVRTCLETLDALRAETGRAVGTVSSDPVPASVTPPSSSAVPKTRAGT